MSKKLLIPSLLTVGLVSLLIGVSPVFDKNKNPDNAKIIFGGMAIGFICLGLSGYFIWNNQQKQKSEKEKISYLRKAFLELIEATDGRITILEFVSHITRLGETEISGDEARLFLEQMAREFDGGYNFTDFGNTIYFFETSKSNVIQNSTPKPVKKDIQNLKPTPTSIPTPIQQSKVNFKSSSIPLDPHLLKALEEHLTQKNWQKADELTSKLMLKASSQTMSLNPDDITHFPLEHLQKLDELWQIHSNNRFGFLAQLEVFKECFPGHSRIVLDSETWRKYGSSLEWYVNGQWPNHHHDLNFSSDVPKGHLPFLPIWQGAWWGAFIDGQGERFHLFLQRIEQAKLCTHVVVNDINSNDKTQGKNPIDPFQELGEKIRETFDLKNNIL